MKEEEKKEPTTKLFDITLPQKGDLTHILSSNGVEKPALRGFDAEFQDIVDYIIKITHEIWEERGIGRLYEYYGTNIRVHTSSGDIYTRDAVIEATIQALAAFPNRRLYGDEVVWKGNDRDGFYTSHRLTHEGNNWGHTAYGPPSGRRVSYRAIADCAVIENRIYEEWLVRDELTLIHQLGFDVHELARKMSHAEAEMSLGGQFSVPGEPDRLQGQRPPAACAPFDSAHFDIEQFVRAAFHTIWNWRLLNKVDDFYAEQFICESASGRQTYGRNQFRTYLLSLMSPLPDLAVSVDHFCALQESEHRYRTATRWTLVGTHKGPGVYGVPTGKPVRVMGMSHHLVENGRFVQEWTVFDEFALLKQLYRPS